MFGGTISIESLACFPKTFSEPWLLLPGPMFGLRIALFSMRLCCSKSHSPLPRVLIEQASWPSHGWALGCSNGSFKLRNDALIKRNGWIPDLESSRVCPLDLFQSTTNTLNGAKSSHLFWRAVKRPWLGFIENVSHIIFHARHVLLHHFLRLAADRPLWEGWNYL